MTKKYQYESSKKKISLQEGNEVSAYKPKKTIVQHKSIRLEKLA